MQKIHYINCPVCKSRNIFFLLNANDETVSKKAFEIWQCKDCSARFTQDVPDVEAIGEFYKSPGYISHSGVSKGVIDKIYFSIRSFTLQLKRKLVEKSTGKNKGNILDIGAGTGAFASAMKKNGWNVTGLEPDDTARSNAKKGFNIELQPIENLFNLQREQFDVITLWHVLEHVHELHKYLDTINNLLIKESILLIAVPNYTSYDAKKYGETWAAYDVPRHLYHFSPKSMKVLLNEHNFKLLKQKPMWFDSFYVSLLSEKYKTGKSNFFSAFINGMTSNFKALGKPQNCSSIIYIAKK